MQTDCTSCGASFQCEGRDDRQSIDGHTLVQTYPVHSDCPACRALGGDVPPSPCCHGGLRGWNLIDVPAFECKGCDVIYPIEVVRTLALGRAVERVLLERPTVADAVREYGVAGSSERREEVLNLILRAARELGVIQ